jgi:hypothetical protein
LTKLAESILELWEDFRDKAVRSRVLACAEALSDNDFVAIPAPTASEANRLLLTQVPLHRTVLYWETSTLDELGIIATLQARGNTTRSAMQLATGKGWRRTRMPQRSVYLSTVCAVTMGGMLVNVEPGLLPVWGPARAPETVILAAGYNHIVDGLDEAFRRVKDECVPQCAKRMGLELDCVKSDRCVECDSPPALCTVNSVVTRKPASPDVVVVLIGERLGH